MFGDIEEHLAWLEARLQNLVEGSMGRLFPGLAIPPDIGSQLAEAMQAGLQTDSEGTLRAPNIYTLYMPTELLQLFQGNQIIKEKMGRYLEEAGETVGAEFSGRVVCLVEEKTELAAGVIQVRAQHSTGNVPKTHSVKIRSEKTAERTSGNAYLVVNGTFTFPLKSVVTNIGRRSDNHLVIDDQRVSRLHAQLRLIGTRYVIFDLDSLGGTWVNGLSIRQQSLMPGDVISLAGVPLIFGQQSIAQEDTQKVGLDTTGKT